MKKQLREIIPVTLFLLTVVCSAQAAPIELNIYGSFAQYHYLNSILSGYAQESLGCSVTSPLNNGGKHGLVYASQCRSTLVPVNSYTGKRDLIIRHSGATSAEGVRAISKLTPLDRDLHSGCLTLGERKMYASSDTTVCKQVHVGISDVDGESLMQSSSGHEFGPLGGDPHTVMLGFTDTWGLTPANTVVVPFGFFVNSAVKAQTCTAGLIGNYCTTNDQCDTGPGNATGTCGAAATITNISREEASLIFSGYVADWSDLGAYFTAQPVVACLHHAGSGAHAALDLTVMNGGWGATVITEEAPGRVWFNLSPHDLMKCINGATMETPTGSLIGAIGYTEASQPIGVANTSQKVRQLMYNGFYPTRTAIRNGLYDFYTNAWLYTNPANGYFINIIADDLATYLQNPLNVPASMANYWATVNEMKYNRDADNGYPRYTGASIPLLP